MDPTTLVTFLFKAPPEVRTVELLGSWDNFSKPYYMHHDRRRGRGFWSGCFNFSNIIFDGDKAEWVKPRSGGLKQGGTYWYFYRLNDAVETYDDFQAYTKGCPLLPGQTLNVIDVPVEVEELPSRRRSATIDVAGTLTNLHRTHTLDPNDKWAALEPPPVSKVHERCISDLALNGRLETMPHSYRDVPASPLASPVSADLQPGLAVPRQRSAHDAHSLRSMNGWGSAPPSRGDSSIFDAYVVNQEATDAASLSAFPLPDAYRTDDRPVTRSGGSAYRGFEFAFDSGSMRHSTSRTGDDDVDGSSFVESPPLSAYGSVDWRFTVTSAHQHAGADHSEREAHEDHRHHQRSPSDPDSSRHRGSEDFNHDADATAFDLSSPTFSAATISSNGGGINTPFRLSVGFTKSSAPPSTNAVRPEEGNDGMANSIDLITERLRQLGSEDSAGSLPSQVSVSTDGNGEQEQRQFIGHYALPIHNAASATTLGKVSYSSASGHASIVTAQDMPPLPTTGGFAHEASFADDIFSELGYLGASIA